MILVYNEKSEINKFIKILASVNYNYGDSKFISRTKRTIITSKIIGISRRLKIIYSMQNINSSTKILFMLRSLNILGIQNALIKPSSGIFALLYFLYFRIDPGPFYLAGIGCKDDGHVSDKNKSFNLAHLHYDLSILKQLSKTIYSKNIICTDKELSEATGLNYYNT
jgi:hypothetical protein